MAYIVYYYEGPNKYKLAPQGPSKFCNFYLSDLSFDTFSKVRVDRQNNAWIISKNGIRVLSPENPWEIKFSLDLSIILI